MMTNKEFMNYVWDQLRQGLSNIQIAKKLGMTLVDFEKKFYGKNEEPVKKIDIPEPEVIEEVAEKEPEPVVEEVLKGPTTEAIDISELIEDDM